MAGKENAEMGTVEETKLSIGLFSTSDTAFIESPYKTKKNWVQ